MMKLRVTPGAERRSGRVPLHRCRVEKCRLRVRERRPQTTGKTGTTGQEREDDMDTHAFTHVLHVFGLCRFAMASSMGWEPSLWGSKWGWRRMTPPAI